MRAVSLVFLFLRNALLLALALGALGAVILHGAYLEARARAAVVSAVRRQAGDDDAA